MKTILMTGASSGLGAALAKAYAAEGITLCLIGRNKKRLAVISKHCQDLGAQVLTAAIDVTDQHMMADQICHWDQTMPLDLVIANAGISGGTAQGHETDNHIRQIFETNVMGVLNTVLPVLPAMRDRQSGQIAIVGSLAGYRGLPGAPAYSASKNAVRAWGEALRLQLKPDHIRVNVIAPGFVRTPLTDKNPFHMPLLMEADKAAAYIKKGLAQNKARIAFPFRMAFLSRMISILPGGISDLIVSKLPKK